MVSLLTHIHVTRPQRVVQRLIGQAVRPLIMIMILNNPPRRCFLKTIRHFILHDLGITRNDEISTINPHEGSWGNNYVQVHPGSADLTNNGIKPLRPRQNGRHFADDIFKGIFLNENGWIPIKISLKFVSQGPINNIPALVQIIAWRRPGDKPLSGPMMVRWPTHICVTRPQWVNSMAYGRWGRNLI